LKFQEAIFLTTIPGYQTISAVPFFIFLKNLQTDILFFPVAQHGLSCYTGRTNTGNEA